MPLYGPGEPIKLIGTFIPGFLAMADEAADYPIELPHAVDRAGKRVPHTAFPLGIFLTERGLLIGWLNSTVIDTAELPLTEEQTANAHFRGGVVGPYEVGPSSLCKCRIRRLAGWDIADVYPGSPIVNEQRRELVGTDRDSTWGLVPTRVTGRYSRP